MSDEIKDVQEQRGLNYGEFEEHAKTVDNIMSDLKAVSEKNGVVYPDGFKTALFYMVSKLVRLSTNPMHGDSALDLSSYANLWLERFIRNDKL